MTKKGLGKGLAALIPSKPIFESKSGDTIKRMQVKDVIPNPQQPRKAFDEEKIRELAESIKEHGVLQPIVVRPVGQDKFEIVAGERRWRACQLAEVKEIPAIVKELDEKGTTELALIENIQREDLNSLEEAEAYAKLIKEYGYTQEKLASRLGKSRSHVANTMRLLNLSLPHQELVRQGLLSPGHARAVLSMTKADKQQLLAQQIVDRGLSVREAEELAKLLNQVEEQPQGLVPHREPSKIPLSPVLKDLENRLRTLFGTKVAIKVGPKGGKIEIDYYGDGDLERIIERILPEDTL